MFPIDSLDNDLPGVDGYTAASIPLHDQFTGGGDVHRHSCLLLTVPEETHAAVQGDTEEFILVKNLLEGAACLGVQQQGFQLLQDGAQYGGAWERASGFDPQGGGLFRQFRGEGFRIGIDPNAQDHVFHPINFRSHLGQNAADLAASNDHVVRPLELSRTSGHRADAPADRNAGQKGDAADFRRDQAWPQQNAEPNPRARWGFPCAAQTSFAARLPFREEHTAVRCAALRLPFGLFVGGIYLLQRNDVFADCPRM